MKKIKIVDNKPWEKPTIEELKKLGYLKSDIIGMSVDKAEKIIQHKLRKNK